MVVWQLAQLSSLMTCRGPLPAAVTPLWQLTQLALSPTWANPNGRAPTSAVAAAPPERMGAMIDPAAATGSTVIEGVDAVDGAAEIDGAAVTAGAMDGDCRIGEDAA